MNEEIDKGPIIGVSPKIRISDDKDRLLSHPLHYYHKVTKSSLDFMVKELLDKLVESYDKCILLPIKSIDFEKLCPEEIKLKMQSPLLDKSLRISMATPEL